MPEEQVIVVVGIAGVYQGDGTMFTEEALRGLAEKDDRFEYDEGGGKLSWLLSEQEYETLKDLWVGPWARDNVWKSSWCRTGDAA